MSSITENIFFAEPLLIEKLKTIPEFAQVGTFSELERVIEAAGQTPAAFVVYDGPGQGASLSGAATLASQVWTVAILVRHGDAAKGNAKVLEIAGRLCRSVINKFTSREETLENCRPMTLVGGGPTPRYYAGGQGVFYLSFSLTSPMLPR